jgi:hypothetical protein
MLWPPPTRGERVALACGCGCRATVIWRVPLLFIYSIRFVEKDPGCRDARHLNGKRKLVTLESLASGAGPEPTV